MRATNFFTSHPNTGVYAQLGNIGDHRREVFAVVPEVTLNVGRQFGESVRVYVGYNFLYLSNVLRPGSEIDPHYDLAPIFVPGQTSTAPAFLFHSTGFWAQGVSFGMEFRF